MTELPPSHPPIGKRALFARGSWTEATRIAALLRGETVGGALLLVGDRGCARLGEFAVVEYVRCAL